MNSQTTCTVRDLLPEKLEGMRDAVDERIATDAELTQQRWPRFVHKIIANKAADAVFRALSKSVFLILPPAWSSAPELQEYSDQTKHPPEKETTLFLGEHKFDVCYTPVVNINVMGFERPLLRLKLTLSIQARGASITIKNGHITSIGECDCAMAAELKYVAGAEDVEKGLHTKVKSRDLQLVEPLQLEAPGVRIGGSREPRRESD